MKLEKFKLKKQKLEISEESAHASVMQVLEFYDIDVLDTEDKDAKEVREVILSRLIHAYRQGKLENKINDETKKLNVLQHIKNSEGATVQTIKYGHVTGKDRIQTDGKEENARRHAFLGSISGLGEAAFSLLSLQDLSIAECFAMLLFLA